MFIKYQLMPHLPDIQNLKKLYDRALAVDSVIGLSIGTRPDCVPDQVLDLLVQYQQQGFIIWLELGLQSSFDAALARVNRGHGWQEYEDACLRARAKGLKVCTHLIAGLPGERLSNKHGVKGTQLAREWKAGRYSPIVFEDYVDLVVQMLRKMPKDVVVHRLSGTASEDILLAPKWCGKKWAVLNAIHEGLKKVTLQA